MSVYVIYFYDRFIQKRSQCISYCISNHKGSWQSRKLSHTNAIALTYLVISYLLNKSNYLIFVSPICELWYNSSILIVFLYLGVRYQFLSKKMSTIKSDDAYRGIITACFYSESFFYICDFGRDLLI